VKALANHFVRKMNEVAVRLLTLGNYDDSFCLLLKAQKLYQKYTRYIAKAANLETLNNLACCYLKFGYESLSQKAVEAALKFTFDEKLTVGLASTYTNTCCVYSALGKHSKAYENIIIAIKLLEEEIKKIEETNYSLIQFKKVFVEKIRSLVLGYYNASVEALHLKQYSIATNYLDKAFLCLKNFLVNEQGISSFADEYTRFYVSLKALRKKLQLEIAVNQKVPQDSPQSSQRFKVSAKPKETKHFDYQSLNNSIVSRINRTKTPDKKPYSSLSKSIRITTAHNTPSRSPRPFRFDSSTKKPIGPDAQNNEHGKTAHDDTDEAGTKGLFVKIRNKKADAGLNATGDKFESLTFISPIQWVFFRVIHSRRSVSWNWTGE
jgi:tetratricopeptide (TPR) repeat protein